MGEKEKEFAVIGLGRFGGSICRELAQLGMEVMAIDSDEDKINEFAKYFARCNCRFNR